LIKNYNNLEFEEAEGETLTIMLTNSSISLSASTAKQIKDNKINGGQLIQELTTLGIGKKNQEKIQELFKCIFFFPFI